MAKQAKQDLMKLDFYEILEIPIDSDEKQVKKSYRKKALKCHPDKNPDNPDAAQEFDKLKKILEILLDAGARRAYDKLLKARKASAIRAREADSKSQKLRTQLEERERKAYAQPKISEEERLRRELKRLEDEGQRIIEDELERLNKQVAEEIKRAGSSSEVSNYKEASKEPSGYKIKVRWAIDEKFPGYTEKEIHQLFYKWGEINALVMKQKPKKGTALIEYKEKSGADMAVQFEKGQIGKPVEVSLVVTEPSKLPDSEKVPDKEVDSKKEQNKYDFESVAAMNNRRQEERRKLIEQILKEESMN